MNSTIGSLESLHIPPYNLFGVISGILSGSDGFMNVLMMETNVNKVFFLKVFKCVTFFQYLLITNSVHNSQKK